MVNAEKQIYHTNMVISLWRGHPTSRLYVFLQVPLAPIMYQQEGNGPIDWCAIRAKTTQKSVQAALEINYNLRFENSDLLIKGIFLSGMGTFGSLKATIVANLLCDHVSR